MVSAMATVWYLLPLRVSGNAAARKRQLESRREFKRRPRTDRKSTRLNSSHSQISYAVFCLKKKNRIHSSPSAIQSPTVSYCPRGSCVRVLDDVRRCCSTAHAHPAICHLVAHQLGSMACLTE